MAVLRGGRSAMDDGGAGEATTARRPADNAGAFLDMEPGGHGVWTVPGAAPPKAPTSRSGGTLASAFARSGLGGRATSPVVTTPEGARYEERVHRGAAGARAYKVYVPAGDTGEPLPLVVMLHGCTQSPDDFALGTQMNAIAEEERFIVVYPEQDRAANASKCWNWFNRADQDRASGEPALIAGITREVMRDLPVDPTRVYIAGLSAGGAAAAIMGVRYPDLYAAAGVHSGLACGAARDLPSALAAMRNGAPGAGVDAAARIPTIVFHGDKDGTVNVANSAHVLKQANSTHRLERRTIRGEAGERAFTRTVHLDAQGKPILEQWLVHGAGHAWSGGSASGSYADPTGPNASREMIRFFREHRLQ
ncbi:MAG TPA: PHB depolymerase family esterase [Beijerinckiaceae bacterium]